MVKASSWSWVTKIAVVSGGPQDLLDLVAHLRAQVGVEVREGLVEEQQRGRGRQRARHRHPLLLAAGQLVGVAPRRSSPRPTRSRIRAPGRRAPARGRRAQAEGDIVRDGEVGEQRVVLEDDADAPRPPGGRSGLPARATTAPRDG